MKIILLVLLTAATLPAATVLPESYAEWTIGGSHFNIVGDDGSSVVGSMGGELSPFFGPMDYPFLSLFFEAAGTDLVAKINGYWVPLGLGGADLIFDGPGIAVTPEPVLSGPFTFYGEAYSYNDPPYIFTGQGTVYFTLVTYEFAGQDPWREIASVRYEFEAIPTPEPATWGMLLLGLGAACWAGKKRR